MLPDKLLQLMVVVFALLEDGPGSRVAGHGYGQLPPHSVDPGEDLSQVICCCRGLCSASLQTVLEGKETLPDWVTVGDLPIVHQ